MPHEPSSPLRLHLGGRPLSVVGRARVYVCGVTPYDVTHLGHAATFVWVDAADRVLRRLGVQVEVCRNVTDVDDVLFDAAARAGAHYDRFAAIQQFHFDHDMDALGVRRPAFEPRAHAFVPEVVALAAALLEAGAAYVSGGSVYFRGADVAGAHGLDREQALALLAAGGGHVDDPAKHDPLDQAVWQSSEQDPAARTASRCRRGRRPGARAGRAGTPSARRWPCRPTARRSTCTPAAPTCASRTTPTRRRRPSPRPA